MFGRLACFSVAIVAAFPGAVQSATVHDLQYNVAPLAQGQLFYSDAVSMVTNGAGYACMVSVGSDWPNTGLARHAADVDAAVARGMTAQGAFDQAEPVDIKSLRANTPFISFVLSSTQGGFVRIGAGMQVAEDQIEISYGTQRAPIRGTEIEPRGDAVLVSDAATVDAMLDAFLEENIFLMTARSVKSGGAETEHVLRYQFDGIDARGALETCLADLEAAEKPVTASRIARLALESVEHATAEARGRATGSACNRDLDPAGAELVRLDGPIQGFATPLAHALVKRDASGEITDIWSGDLWRIARVGDGYAMAVSNSIRKQSPLDTQSEKACTRLADSVPVTLNEDEGGALSIAPARMDLLPIASVTDPVSAFALAGQSAPLVRRARSAQAMIALPSAPPQQTFTTVRRQSDPISSTTSISDIVAGQPGGDTGQTQQSDAVSPVPVPAAGVLMLGALAGMGWTTRRRRKPA